VPQSQASRTATLRIAEVPHRRELELGWCATVQQMQQGRERRGRESQQGQRVQEAHARRRKAMPNGKSVVTWW
jgi:hypothetical protein